jgi:hypothetical protein
VSSALQDTGGVETASICIIDIGGGSGAKRFEHAAEERVPPRRWAGELRVETGASGAP